MEKGVFTYSLLLLVLSVSSIAALHANIVRIEIFVNDSAGGMVPVNPITDDSAPGDSTQGSPVPSPPGTVPIEEYVNAPQQQQPQYNIVPIESLFWDAGSLSLSSRVQDFKYEIIYAGSIADVKLSGVPISHIEVGSWKAGAGIAVDSFQYAGFSQAYAIDAVGVDSATATITAVGDSLYKCANWDFASRTCNGEWEFQKTITPGQEYSIAISPGDPAYGENMSGHPAAPSPSPPPVGPNTLAMVNSRGELYETNITISDSSGKGISGGRKQMGVGSMPASSYRVGFVRDASAATRANPSPLLPPVEDIVFEDLRLPSGGNAVLRVDTIDPFATPFGMHAKKAYAIDPSSLNFTRGTVKVMARGTELYKCAGWIFDSGTCAGGWEKVMDIIPGQYYYINITPDDPGYVEYSPYLGAPVCLTTDSPCIAGSDLLQSRDSILGTQEPNQPNTLDTCTDGTSGTYGSDESAENITINATASSYFTAGSKVNVSAWVHPYSGGGDYADIFYSNTTYPLAWKLMYTSGALSGTYQEVSTVFILDSVSGQHAVRVQFRYGGDSTTNCSTGGYDDHDDVAFQVTNTTNLLSACRNIVSSGAYRLSNNLLGNQTTGAACIYIGASNTAVDCAGYTITGNTTGTTYGIRTASSLENITVTNCFVRNYTYGLYVDTPTYVELFNNTAYNNSIGIYSSGGQYVILRGNTAYENRGASAGNGFRFINAKNYTVAGNTAFNNSGTNGGYGIYILWPYTENNFTDNAAYNNSYGFYVNSNGGLLRLARSNFLNNTAINNTNDGFYLEYAENNTFANNTAYLNKRYGIYLSSSSNNNLSNNSAYSNSQYGLYIQNSNATNATNTHLFGNLLGDFYITTDATPRTVYLGNLTLDNPLGNYENYTSLNITDIIEASSAYKLKWTANSTALPAGRLSFAQKFIDITTISGTVSIDSIIWSWLDSELGAEYNETKFELWKYSSGWAALNITPDTAAHTLGLTNMNPASTYGILQNNYTGCINLSDPTTWQGKTANSSGVLYVNLNTTLCTDTYYLNNATSTAQVIQLNASNIYLNCNQSIIDGIDKNGYGIYTTDKANNTIENCTVRNYGWGIYLLNVNYSRLAFNTAYNNTEHGIKLQGSASGNNTIINNVVYNNSVGGGIQLDSTPNNNVTNNTAYNNAYGIIALSNSNTITNNSAFNNTYGYVLVFSNYNIVKNNTAYGNSQHGFYVLDAFFNNMTDNIAYNNSGYGVYLGKYTTTISANNTFTNTFIYNQSYYLFQQATAAQPNNFTNLTLGYNSTIGWVNYNFLNITNLYLNISNLILNPYFVSLNDSDATQANQSANITILTADCSHSIFSKAGFPSTRGDITANGTLYTPLSRSCSSNTLTFGVGGFTGYSSGSECINLSDPTTWRTIGNASGVLYINENTTLCTDTYYLNASASAAALQMNASNIYLDCNGSTLDGVDGNGWGIYSQLMENNTIMNCLLTAYNNGIYLEYSNGSTVSNSTSYENAQTGFYLLATSGSMIANNTAYNNTYGIYTDSASYNNFVGNDLSESEEGFQLSYSSNYNNLTNNIAYNSSFGFYLFSSSNNTITNNSAYNNTNGGFILGVNFDGNNITNNTAHNNSQGFYIINSSIINVLTNTAYDNAYGFFAVTSSHNNTFTGNVADNNTDVGFYLSASSGNAFTNNTAYSNEWYGFYIISSTSSSLTNNTAHDSIDGFRIENSNYSSLQRNTAYNSTYGFYLTYANSSQISNSTSYGNTGSGVYMLGSSGNVLTGITSRNNSQYGIYLSSSSNNNLTNNFAYNNTLTNIVLYSNANLNTLINNSAYTSLTQSGFYMDSSTGNLLENNTAQNNSAYGIYLANAATGNTFRGNQVRNNTNYGVYLLVVNANSFEGNHVYNNSNNGYYIQGSYNTFTNDRSWSNYNTGFVVVGNSNNFTNISSAGNSMNGFYLASSNSNILTNCTGSGGTNNGAYVINSDNNIIDNSTFTGANTGVNFVTGSDNNIVKNSLIYSAYYGVRVLDASGNNITSTRFYGMTTDAIYVLLSAVSMNLYLSNATFDNPSGTMENYTVLDLTDSIEIGESYAIRYAQNNTALPDGRLAFAQKFINISTPNSTVSIDSIIWSWQAPETTGYTESRFELWKYGTNWTLLNSTPDTTAHTLGLTNMNPASTYGILQGPYTGCVNLSNSTTWGSNIVNSSGVLYVNLNTTLCTDTYYLNNATSTAQVIQMNASNIYLNCNGSTIDGMDKDGYGIYTSMSNDIIANCTVRNYNRNIFLVGGGGNKVISNEAYNATYGILLSGASNNTVINNVAHNNSVYGFLVQVNSNDNNLTNNTAYGNPYGFYLYQASRNRLTNNTAYLSSVYGFLLTTSSHNNTINGNRAFNTTNTGIYVSSSSHQNNITNNVAYLSGQYGIIIASTCYYNILMNNSAYNNTHGFLLQTYANYNILINNSAYNNTYYGIYLTSNSSNNSLTGNAAWNNQNGFLIYTDTIDNNFTDNLAYNNSQYGFYIYRSSRGTFLNNNASYNLVSGFLISDSNLNRFFNNSAFFNVQNGFYLSASYNNTLEGNIAYNNSQNGFLIYTGSVDNNFTGNLAENNSQYGFYTYASNHSILINNNASYNLASGFLIYTDSNFNILMNNTAFKNSNMGFYLYSNLYNNLTNNTARNNTNYGFYNAYGNYSIFTNNTAFGSTYCFYPTTVSFNTFTGNTAYNCAEGFQIASSSNNTFTNNTAYRNSDTGFYLPSSSSNNLTNNSAYYNSYGLYISSANYNNFIGNNFSSNIQGLDLITSSYNNLTGNIASNNTQRGFYLQSSSNYNTLANNTAYNNTIYGIDLVSSTGNNLTGNNASYNVQNGINLDAASGSNNLAYNYACFNTLTDINNLSSGNTGLGDRCDDWFSWSESGHVGCAKTCSEIWHTFYGNASGSIVLAKSSSNWAYSWEWSGTGNVYAANADESIHWGQLQALGRNTTGGNSTDDFEELDSLLGYSAITADNINYTFSSDGSNPKETASFRVYMLPIANVSIANSTNSTAHRTGILWDMADGGTEFNPVDSQAVVFMTNITQNAPGKYAGYTDYEIRVPGTLDTYKGTSELVYFYLELD